MIIFISLSVVSAADQFRVLFLEPFCKRSTVMSPCKTELGHKEPDQAIFRFTVYVPEFYFLSGWEKEYSTSVKLTLNSKWNIWCHVNPARVSADIRPNNQIMMWILFFTLLIFP